MKINRISLWLFGALAVNAGGISQAVAADEVVPVTNTLAFAPTVPNKTPPPAPAPEGMLWIPGGEFSMGCKVPSEGVCTMATMNAVNDAQPIHRVYVDGFWMDRTDVTNEEFAKFVEGHRLCHDCRTHADKGRISQRSVGKSGGRFPGFYVPVQASTVG